MAPREGPRRKGGRSRASRRAEQADCCGLETTPRRQRKVPPQAAVESTSTVKLSPSADTTTHLFEPPSSLPPSPQLQPSAPPQRRSVSFDLEAGTQHEITPYAEVYGLHPSEFLFERHDFVLLLADEELGCYAPDDGDNVDEDTEEDEEDEDIQDPTGEDSWVLVPAGC